MFERFTDRARRVLVLAQEEARIMNHNFIGTEHILLGILHEGQGVGAKALEALGVSLADARARVEQTIGPATDDLDPSPPFTPRAKMVLELSLREALQLGHNYIGTEHLLLGLVREGEGVAPQVLVSLGVSLSDVRQQVISLLSGYLGHAQSRSSSDEPTMSSMSFRVEGQEEPPRCGWCSSSMAGNLAYKTIEATSADGPPLAFVVVYCNTCGREVTVEPAASDQRGREP